MLIYFIHHVSSSIQLDDVVAVRRQVEMIGRGVAALDEELDRVALRQRLDHARSMLDARGAALADDVPA